MPVCRNFSRAALISATTIGARPRNGSSSSSRRGALISARPIAQHLLLAARERARPPACAAPRAAGTGRRRSRIAPAALPFSRTAPRRRLSSTREGREDEPALRAPEQRRARRWRGSASSTKFLVLESDLPAAVRDRAGDRRHQRRLAGAVRPEQRHRLALVDVQAHALQHRRRAVAGRQVIELQHGFPDRRPSRPDCARMSSGSPSAILAPKLSTTTRCASGSRKCMSCSMSSTAMPRAAMPRMISARRSSSAGARPAAGSSKQDQARLAARARARSRAAALAEGQRADVGLRACRQGRRTRSALRRDARLSASPHEEHF